MYFYITNSEVREREKVRIARNIYKDVHETSTLHAPPQCSERERENERSDQSTQLEYEQ